MKTATFTIMIMSWTGLVILLARIAVVTLQSDTGLPNPAIRIELLPDTRIYFFSVFSWALMASYLHAVVSWADRRMNGMEAALPVETANEAYRQPREVKRLKDAIRAGDVEAVRCYADEIALSHRDESVLTPYELAELYGNPAVIAAMAAAFRRHFGGPAQGDPSAAPSNRFASGQRLG
jgi:hypothetical protein